MKSNVIRSLPVVIALAITSLMRGQLSAELLGLMAEAQRVAASGDLAAVTALAVRNPGLVTEITQTALQAMPGNRLGVVNAMLQAMPTRASEVAVAAAKGAPTSFGAELTQILTGRPAGEVVAIAAKVAASEPKAAVITASVACAAAPQQAPNIAAVIVPSAPQQAAAVVAAAISGSGALQNRVAADAAALTGAIAAAAAAKVPAQAANIVQVVAQAPGLLGWAKAIDNAPLAPVAQAGSLFAARVIAVTAAAVVQSVPSAMESILVQVANAGQANGWVAPANSSGVNLACMTGVLLASVNPGAAQQVIATLASVPGGAVAAQTLVKNSPTYNVMEVYAVEVGALAAATKSAQTAVVQGSNVPLLAAPAAPPASSPTATTPSLPIDPSLVVSPSK